MASGKPTDEPKVKVYAPGIGGVQLVKNRLQLDDTEVTSAQNAEVIYDEDLGGDGAISKRGGLRLLNTGALAGSVLGMFSGSVLPEIPQGPWVPSIEVDLDVVDPDDSITAQGGASTLEEAVADATDDTYVRMRYGNVNNSSVLVWVPQMTFHVDPGVDTGHTLTMRWRRRRSGGGSYAPGAGVHGIGLIIGQDWNGSSFGTNHAILSGLTPGGGNFPADSASFQDCVFTLTAPQVQSIRAAGGYDEIQLYIAWNFSGVPAETVQHDLDISRIYMESP